MIYFLNKWLIRFVCILFLFTLVACTKDDKTIDPIISIPVTPNISVDDAGVIEGDTGTVTANFNVLLSEATTQTVSVQYSTNPGTASEGADYTSTSGTLTFNAGEAAKTINVDVLGDTIDEANETFTLILSNADNANISGGTAVGTITDDDGTPIVPDMSIDDVSVTEGDVGTVTASFTVSLSESTSQPVSVQYNTSNATATAGSDYTAASGTVTFNAGETSKTINVSVIGDTTDESNETFNVILSSPINAAIVDGSGIGTITDDDTTPSIPNISISDANVVEGDAGTVTATFDVLLSPATSQTVSVLYNTNSGSATQDVDYTGANGTLTFNSGESAKTINVDVIGDTTDEGNETFSVTLFNPQNVIINDGTGVGTITDDDGAPIIPDINIDDVSVTEGDTGTVTASFTVTLSASTSQSVSVQYSTSDVTANFGSDYTAASGTVTFNVGETSKSINVSVTGDTADEPNETFNVILSNPGNATIADGSGVGTITNDDATPGSGLDQRPSNTTCIAPDRPSSTAEIQLNQVFTNLSFTFPLGLVQAPGDTTRWFVVEQGGFVRVFNNTPSVTSSSVFIDITDRVDASFPESGLLGIAFHPDFQTNRHVYLSYTSTGLVSYISRFESLDGGLTLDPTSEQAILTLNQPYNNHNGGHITFGPDGYLYIGFGDGGSGGDPLGNGQNTNTLLGALLRIDVNVSQPDWDSGTRYYIPTTNHFSANASCASGNGCPEIFAWGFRNPWRWSFDKSTGDLWLGDVGQYLWEEIDLVEGGGNYGWNIREGAHCYNATTCDTTGLFDPVAEYTSADANCSVTGGYVYRGTAIPALQGVYIYGDFCTGRIWGFDNSQATPTPEEKLVSGRSISSFAEDSDGELYVIDYVNGSIYQIAESVSGGLNTIPAVLSDTGCFDAIDPTQPAPGMIPYDVNSKLWSDGVVKERFIAIPDSTTIEIDATENWIFPIGAVLVKQFRHEGKLIETRLLMRHTDGGWGAYTYEWDDLETDATLVIGGKTKSINGLAWVYPSSAQCMYCHTAVAGRSLGPETAQMNRNFYYVSTDRTSNQLQTYDSIGLFSAPLSNTPANLPALVDPTDNTADLEQRVRSYLHSNCANCHQLGGPTPANIRLHYAIPTVDMNMCDVAPTGGDLGITDARIVAPGDPAKSILVNRMQRRDIYGMPPLGSDIVDATGVALMESWITGLGAVCP